MNEILIDPGRCCGCGTCQVVCPQNCIIMAEDEYGFKFPYVDKRNCTSCGKCLGVCPADGVAHCKFERKIYAAYSKNPRVRFEGSSGGMFGAFAKKTIDAGGIVYGAYFKEKLKLVCGCAGTEEELGKLYKSKYLQSDMENRFLEIQENLESGKKVLVCSTPCQISAIRKYFNKDYDNLILIDFLCHGVPSQSFFDKCIEWVEKKRGIEIIDYEFRSKKRNGKTPHYFTYTYIKNRKLEKSCELYLSDPFYYGFQQYLTLREACYQCPYAFGIRASDITIGDFHVVEDYWENINRFEGVSLLITNSQRGQSLMDDILGSLEYKELSYAQLLDDKVIFQGPTEVPENRNLFLNDLREKDFGYIVGKWLTPKKDVYKYLYYSMPDKIRKFLRAIRGI